MIININVIILQHSITMDESSKFQKFRTFEIQSFKHAVRIQNDSNLNFKASNVLRHIKNTLEILL